MPDYISVSDCRERLRDEFENFYTLPGEAADLDKDIAAVEAIVNASVGKRYTIPVTDTDAVAYLETLCLDLLEERAHKRGAGSEIPEKIKDAAAAARKELEAIRTGAVTLAGAEGIAERASGGADAIIVDGNDPEFTRDDMEGF